MAEGKLPPSPFPSPTEAPVTSSPFKFKTRRSPKAYDDASCGYECEFVTPPPSVLPTECAICLQVLREPHLISCCGHNFCRLCIAPIVERQRPCPLCSEPEFTVLRNKGLERSLNEQAVRCPRSGDGCGWEGELGKLLRHLNASPEPGEQLSGCDYVSVECAHGCGAKLLRRALGEHQANQCPQRPYSCVYCQQYDSIHADVVYRHWPVCKQYPIPCPNNCADYRFERQYLQTHLETECPLRVVDCDFQYAGCDVRKTRQEMSVHLRESYVEHLSLLAMTNQKLCEEVLEKEDQISRLGHENSAHITEACSELGEELSSLKTHNSSLEADVVSLMTEVAELRQNLTEEAGKRRELEEKVEHVSREEKETFQGEIEKLRKQMEHFVDSLTQQCYSVQGYIGLFPTEFTLSGFEQLLQNGQEWRSSPVYSYLEGYRFCLSVTVGGHNSEKGEHVSVHVCLMRGEFDNRLAWPFRGKITVQLLNRLADRNHATGVIHFSEHTPAVYGERVMEGGGEVGRGWGQQKFISHSDLGHNAMKNRQYLVDDSLRFRITKVESFFVTPEK